MALVIYNSEYLKPESKFTDEVMRAGLDYISTRKYAHEITDEEKAKMNTLSDPDRSGLNYISERRGSAEYGDKPGALFNEFGKANVDFEESLRHEYPDSFEWRVVVSLQKEDAIRVGYTSPYAFQQLCTRVMPQVAELYNISPENLIWNAAYHPIDKHGSGHHPHIHIHFYSKDPSEGVGSKEHTQYAFEKARSIFTNDIFRDELQKVSAERTAARDRLSEEIERELNNPPAELMAKLDSLSQELPNKGRMSYGYMPPKVKRHIDAVVRDIVNQPEINKLFCEYYSCQLEQISAYNDDEEKIKSRMKSFEKAFFHPTGENDRAVIHNAVIKSAVNIKKYIAKQQKYLHQDIFVRAAAGLDAPYDLNRASPFLREVVAKDIRFKGMTREQIRKTIYKSMLENLNSETDKVYGILRDDGELRERLSNEVRLDAAYESKLHAFENENQPGDELQGQFDCLSDETRGDLMYYIHSAVDKYDSVGEKAIEEIIAKYTDYGLRFKTRSLIKQHMDRKDFDGLRKQIGCRNITVDAMTGAEYSNTLPILKPLMLKFSRIDGETYSISDEEILKLVMDEHIRTAYYMNLEQCYAEEIKPEIDDKLRERILEFADVRTQIRDCTDEQQAVCSRFIGRCSSRDIDRRGIEYLSDRIVRYVVIDNATSADRDICGYIGLNSEYDRDDEKLDELLCKHIRGNPLLKELPNGAVDYTKNMIYRKCYSENLKAGMKHVSEIVKVNRELIKNLSAKVTLDAEFDNYPNCRERTVLMALLPKTDEKTANILKNIYRQAVCRERVKQIIVSDPILRKAALDLSADMRRTIKSFDISSPDDFTAENRAQYENLCDEICAQNPELQSYRSEAAGTSSYSERSSYDVFYAIKYADYVQNQTALANHNIFAALLSVVPPAAHVASEPQQQQQRNQQNSKQQLRRSKHQSQDKPEQQNVSDGIQI